MEERKVHRHRPPIDARGARRVAVVADVDPRTVLRAYRGGKRMIPAAWHRIAQAAESLKLTPPPPLVAGAPPRPDEGK